MRGGPWPWVAGLAVLQGALGWALWWEAREERVVYVLTPMVDVVPGGAPLSAVEAEAVARGVRGQVDARDMQTAYARLGSTLSVDDLVRGVAGLEAAGVPLDAGQRERVRATLDAATADRAALLATQREILDLEAALEREARAVVESLPADVRARVGR